MKKEYIYILVPIILCLLGILFKSLYLSETLQNTQVLLNTNSELSAQFYRDSLVQNNISELRRNFQQNKRDARTYGEVIADLLKITENMLQKSNIEYKGNDINQDFDEVKNLKSGVSSFFISVNFTTEYKNFKAFLSNIEQDTLLINLASIEITRTRPDSKLSSNVKEIEIDEFNIKTSIDVKIRLEFVKFL